MSELTLQIDGKTVLGNPGDTILQVCERNEIYVPTLCHFQELTNAGTCRMCTVEVQGERGFVTACTTPARDGMVVKTESEALKELRRSVLQLLFAERNHYCMYCEMSGQCELQNLAYRYQIDHFKYPFMFPKLGVDSSAEHFVLDHNRCVLCTRCVRVCSELVANDTLGPMRRGAATLITADLEEAIGNSSCVSCGSCVQVCPTGALFDRRSSYADRTETPKRTSSVCPGCSLGCPVEVVSAANQVVRIEGKLGSKVYRGLLCAQGRYGPLRDGVPRRDVPLIRSEKGFRKASWEEAFGLIVKELQARTAAGKGPTIGGIVSPRATNEATYLLQKLFRTLLKSNNLTVLGQVAVPDSSFTAGYVGATLTDVEDADHILVLGADPIQSYQVLGFAIKRALRKGASLTLVGPRTNALAELATAHLVPVVTDYGALANGLVTAVIGNGLAKQPAGAEVDLGPDFEKFSANLVAKRTGIPEGQVKETALAYGRAKAPVILWTSPDDALEIVLLSLAALTGNFDGKKARILRLDDEVNSRGVREMGSTAGYLPGRVTWDNPLTQRFAEAWAAPLPADRSLPGVDAAYFLLADDKAPLDEMTLRIARKARFVVVQSAYPSALDQVANVVLPAPAWAEKDGTFTSADGLIRKVLPAVSPPAGVPDDWAVLSELCGRLGGKRYESAGQVLAEISALVPDYGDKLVAADGSVASV